MGIPNIIKNFIQFKFDSKQIRDRAFSNRHYSVDAVHQPQSLLSVKQQTSAVYFSPVTKVSLCAPKIKWPFKKWAIALVEALPL